MVIQNKYNLYYWLIFALVIVSISINNWSIGFWDQDESAYAGFAYTFLETGNWMIPDFIWSDVHRKPPLHFWSIALSFKLFGANEFATRIPSALAIIGTCLLILLMGGTLFGKEVAKKAMLIASSGILLIALAKISVTDSMLLFFETLTVFSLFNFLKSKNYNYLIGLVLGIAGGTLTKGPPVLIVTYGILGILFLFKNYRIQTILIFLISLLGLIPIYLWGRAVWNIDNGKFIMWMVDWYILKRGEGVFGQTGPPGYFLIIFLVGMFAFSSFFILGLKEQFAKFFKRNQQSETTIFIVAWLVSGWFVYELISSKLPAYAIGALPAISVLIALQVTNMNTESNTTKWRKFALGAQLFFTIVLGMAFIISAFVFLDNIPRIMALVVGSVVIILGIYSFKQDNRNFLLLCIIALLPSLVAWSFIVPSLESKRSTTKIVANYIEESYPKSTPIVFTKDFALPSLPFYLATAKYKYAENQDWGAWKKSFNEGALLIFNEEGYAIFREQNKELKDTDLRLHQIDGWIPDRGKEISYFILSSTK